MHFRPPANVPLQRKGKQRTAIEHDYQNCSNRYIVYIGKTGGFLEEKEKGADNATYNYHRMQADDTAFEESADTHPVPAVIIGITDYKARKHKEKVDGKIAVVNDLCEMVATRMCFKKMEGYDHNSCHST